MRLPHPIAGFLLVMASLLPAQQEPDAHATTTAAAAPAPVDFVSEIKPILTQYCIKCHGPDEQNGGLAWHTRSTALATTDSGGHAIVPGDPTKSEMLHRLASTDPDLRMPPKGDRPDARQQELLARWITEGANWPDDSAETSPAAAAKTGTHWSFQPIQKVEPPAVNDSSWPKQPIDFFLQAKWEEAGLQPAADATPGVLLRRLSYNLTGLPPAPSDVEEFHRQVEKTGDARAALAAQVDRLLDSPQYGERWGRHWLDWARYADTAGDNSDFPIPQAFLYRNYVIDSLNRDLPFDRFLTEQLAGDLLPASSQEEKNRLTIATGYLAMSRRFGSLVETYPQHLTIEDTLDNLGRTVLGLTLSCARCHDHKFDPISTRDYYGLYGIFESTRYPFPGIELFQTQRDFVPLIPADEVRQKLEPFQKETDKLTQDLNEKLAAARRKELENAILARTVSVEEQRRIKAELTGLLGKARSAGEKLAGHLKKLPDIPSAYAVQDGEPTNAKIQIKGEPDRPGAEVPRKFPDVLGGELVSSEEAAAGSGRLALARWITSRENPLTARVIVNRVWQRHFGRGLVASTSDFGIRGEKPSHPELLDWLATDFMNHGWSLKRLHRLILTSRSWQLSSMDSETNASKDPANLLYWKHERQRLDAESLRDTLLFISGALDPAPRTEPYPIPPSRKWDYTQHHPFKDNYPDNKRSVYQMTKRLTAWTYMQTFDGPDPNVCTPARDASVTALQALYFVNDPMLHEHAERYARQLTNPDVPDKERLRKATLAILSRPPAPDEEEMFLNHLESLRRQNHSDNDAWASVIRSLLRLNEFLYPD